MYFFHISLREAAKYVMLYSVCMSYKYVCKSICTFIQNIVYATNTRVYIIYKYVYILYL